MISRALDSLAAAVDLLAVVALGLAAGAMLAEAAVLVPYWRSLAGDAFLVWYAANASRLLQFYGPLEVASTGLVLVATGLHVYRRDGGARFFVVAAVLAIAVLLTFPLYFRDVNASFATGTIPVGDVATELGRWASWHWVRTAIGTAAFAASVVGVQRAVRPSDAPSRRAGRDGASRRSATWE